ncbi:hypothetical protein ABK905_05425 [Acerihabitans sp. KWT182]|uniref:Uncharacterized protein n=1 Tax=Acerihabitans sp. KWT182 TaxID=3157919 RepID=A0AAU7QC03_9GAMM
MNYELFYIAERQYYSQKSKRRPYYSNDLAAKNLYGGIAREEGNVIPR